MRIRAGHILVAIVAVVALFVFYVTSTLGPEPSRGENVDGLAPPVGVSMDEAPAIALETEALDMGVIPNDRHTEARVRVFNQGGSALEIHDVVSTCALCTRAWFAPGENRIAPGQSAELIIAMNPAGILGFETTKTLSLNCNDPRTPRKQMTVTARVDPEFSLEPEQFDFGVVEKGAAPVRSLVVRCHGEAPLSVKGVSLWLEDEEDMRNDSITFQVESLPEDASDGSGVGVYRITATLLPCMGCGDFELPVFIQTDVERVPQYRIVARGTVACPYSLEVGQPGVPQIVLRRPDAEAVISVRADQAAGIAGLQSERGRLSLEVRETEGGVVEVVCRQKAGLERGRHKDVVLFDVVIDGVHYPECIPVQVYAQGNEASGL